MSSEATGSSLELQALRAEIAALRDRNDLLTAVFNHSPTVIFVKNREGRMILCNPAFERIFSHIDGGLLGKSDAEIAGPEAAAALQANDQLVCDGGVPVEFEEVVRHHDGLHTYISVKFPLYDRHGAIMGIVGIATDISERRRSEQQQRTIEAQKVALSELSTPLIPLAEGVIAMPLVGAIDTERARLIMQALLDGLTASRAHTAILDITGVRMVDAQVAGALLQSARAARLLGAQVIITGIRPDVAQALIQLGTDWTGIATLSTLQAGVALALARAKAASPTGPLQTIATRTPHYSQAVKR